MIIPSIQSKIVATLGPATSSHSVLEALIKNGADVLRLNFAHGSHSEYLQRILSVRRVSRQLGHSVGILQDLPGPKLRIGPLSSKSIDLVRDEEVNLVSHPISHPGKMIPIQYPRLTVDLKRGHTVFIADGSIRLSVMSTKKDRVLCRVIAGGTVRPGNGVNMPKTSLSLRAFTKEDQRHLSFGMAHGVDFVGISFVGNAADVLRARNFAQKQGRAPFIIAKIERQEALNNLKSIIEAADGIMVARGDLGVEVSFSEIPGIQRDIVIRSHQMGKPVIVATQVLESMIENSRPTRAEATDVANAIIEGADAIMLSGETSIGKYPVAAVTALHEVIRATERRHAGPSWDHFVSNSQSSDVIVQGACRIATGVGAKAIVVPTHTGHTAARVSRFRPPLQILALVKDENMSRRFSLHWGMRSMLVSRHLSSENLVDQVSALLIKQSWIRRGQKILLISGGPGVHSNQVGTIQIFIVK